MYICLIQKIALGLKKEINKKNIKKENCQHTQTNSQIHAHKTAKFLRKKKNCCYGDNKILGLDVCRVVTNTPNNLRRIKFVLKN